jgi:phosphoserine aminotransferase
MSSDFLSRPFDIEDYGIVYAHAQKNLGPAGVTVVLLRDDLLARIRGTVPAMLDYREHVRAKSIYNTPPVFSIYVTHLVMRWLRYEVGGLQAMNALNCAKAALLYSVLDANPGFYRGHAAINDRSLMNVTFRLPSLDLERRFLKNAQAVGLYGLEGHRTLGGIRSSLYNAVTIQAVEALCGFMEDFCRLHASEAA